MLQADRNCVLGMDGTGTVQVVGSAGTISLQNLILSNTVVSADCTTAARLKFTLDQDGVSPIQVVNKVVNTPGTKVTVDVGAYEGAKRKVRLVEYKTWTGPALEDVEIVGGEGKDILFRTDDKGPYVWFRKGTMLIVR